MEPYSPDCSPYSWWDNRNAARLGFQPQDRSRDYSDEVMRRHPQEQGGADELKYQGGAFVADDSHSDPSKIDRQ